MDTSFDPLDRTFGGHPEEEWNPVLREIQARVEQKLLQQKQTIQAEMGWHDAFMWVMGADPALASRNWDAFQTENARRVKVMMASNSALEAYRAQEAVWIADSGFTRAYNMARIASLSPVGGSRTDEPAVQQVDSEIAPLVNARIAASDGKEDYVTAWKAVLTERPDLMQRRVRAMG